MLGIESTAHKSGTGVVELPEPGRFRVLSNERRLHAPAHGGIHPREAPSAGQSPSDDQ